mgnify:CR=1 FL=1
MLNQNEKSLEYLVWLESVIWAWYKDEIIYAFTSSENQSLLSLYKKVTIWQFVANGLANKFADEQINAMKIYYVQYFSEQLKKCYWMQINADIQDVLINKFEEAIWNSIINAAWLWYKQQLLSSNSLLHQIRDEMNFKWEGDDISEISEMITISISELYDAYFTIFLERFKKVMPIYFEQSATSIVHQFFKTMPSTITLDVAKNLQLEIESELDMSMNN